MYETKNDDRSCTKPSPSKGHTTAESRLVEYTREGPKRCKLIRVSKAAQLLSRDSLTG
jgi:hypothetical protein